MADQQPTSERDPGDPRWNARRLAPGERQEARREPVRRTAPPFTPSGAKVPDLAQGGGRPGRPPGNRPGRGHHSASGSDQDAQRQGGRRGDTRRPAPVAGPWDDGPEWRDVSGPWEPGLGGAAVRDQRGTAPAAKGRAGAGQGRGEAAPTGGSTGAGGSGAGRGADTGSADPAGGAVQAAGGGGFAGLGVPQPVVDALGGLGVTEPFEIQAATMADGLAGRDVLGQARTGSGKTVAFSVPLVVRLAEGGKPGRARRPQGLVLVPTRELATQVAATLAPLARSVGMRVTTVFGGVGHNPQRVALAAGTEIVVACPGRLLDLMGTGDADLSDVEVTVLDEADHMADQGFLPMVRKILDATPAGGQRLLFSATLAGGVDQLVGRYMDHPVTHSVAVEPPARLDHKVLVVDEQRRVDEVAELCGQGKTVVFCRTKRRAKDLCRMLVARGTGAVELHGNLSQGARERNLQAFADGTATVLVCTDIAARGIHVDEVPLVVHADPPVEHKAYTHRSGRTARAGAEGVVVTVCTLDQVGEVRQLLSRAKVRASWEGIAVDGRAGSAGPRPVAPARPNGSGRRRGGRRG